MNRLLLGASQMRINIFQYCDHDFLRMFNKYCCSISVVKEITEDFQFTLNGEMRNLPQGGSADQKYYHGRFVNCEFLVLVPVDISHQSGIPSRKYYRLKIGKK